MPYMKDLANTLDHSRLEGEVVWVFSDGRFIITPGKGRSLPGDLLWGAIGPQRTASQIEGKWRLEDDDWAIVLTEILFDGKAGLPEARLDFAPAGGKRITLGNRQYTLVPHKP